MKILGIHDSHDSGIALFEDGKIVFAVNQERLDRIKLSSGFPVDSLEFIQTKMNIPLNEIDFVAIAANYGPVILPHTTLNLLRTSYEKSYQRVLLSKANTYFAPFFRSHLWDKGIKLAHEIIYKKPRRNFLIKSLREKGFKGKIEFFDHHLCHAASALFSCPPELFSKKTLIITADGAGDGLSGTVYIAENGNLKKIHEINQYNSLAIIYAYVTEICGFTPMKHEGKITGLAAFGKPTYKELLEKMLIYKNGSFYNISGYHNEEARDFLKNKLGKDFNKANLAASVQAHLEETFIPFLDYWIKKTGITDVLLAGGLFANVKLNQRINEHPKTTSVFIHQNMGDGGIAFGAAALSSFQKTNKYSPPPKHVYFGPNFSEKEVLISLEKYEKISYKKPRIIEKEVARLLAAGKVVARCVGPMEYGPRALGNRTILYQPTDPTVNDWLNKRLKRTEFMPFAPVTLIEEARNCYKNIKGGEYAARFMTITFDCTDFMKKRCPAVVHVDGTARPQLLDKDTNPGYRKILEEYYKLTKIPSLINTSFNMHEEPIVCSPEDALRSFLTGNIDYLILGNFLVSRK